MPKALRPYFRHDRRLFAEVSRLIYSIIAEFYAEAAGRSLLTGVIIAHQTFGDQLRWNPHYHCLVLEGGFDEQGTFVSVPFSGLQAMTEVFRRRVIWLLVEKELLSAEFAQNLLSWRNPGFSIDNSVRVTDARTQESLAQYISRPPLSLKKYANVHLSVIDRVARRDIQRRRRIMDRRNIRGLFIAIAGILLATCAYGIDPPVDIRRLDYEEMMASGDGRCTSSNGSGHNRSFSKRHFFTYDTGKSADSPALNFRSL